MWRFKFSAWAVVLLMTALSFGACDNDDDDTFVPPSNITEALKQVYPAAQNIEWEMKGAYYVADCRHKIGRAMMNWKSGLILMPTG